MEENDIGFLLTPPQEKLYGKLLAFLVGENGKPIDLTATHFKRSKKTLRKRQSQEPKVPVEKKKEQTKSAQSTTCDIFVNGIPYDTKENDIRSLFAECGEIKEIRLPLYFLLSILNCRFQDSGRSRGYCFVTFSSPSEAEAALSKNKQYLGSRYIEVALSTADSTSEPKIGGKNAVVPIDCRCAFVKGIPYDTTEEKVREVLMYACLIADHQALR